MLDLKIDCLRLRIHGGAGCGHRAGPIAERAAGILARRLEERWQASKRDAGPQSVERASVPAVRLDLRAMTDDQAAAEIARACLEALALKLHF
jgi:hypothetical protein